MYIRSWHWCEIQRYLFCIYTMAKAWPSTSNRRVPKKNHSEDFIYEETNTNRKTNNRKQQHSKQSNSEQRLTCVNCPELFRDNKTLSKHQEECLALGPKDSFGKNKQRALRCHRQSHCCIPTPPGLTREKKSRTYLCSSSCNNLKST